MPAKKKLTRRKYTDEFKARAVAESSAPKATVDGVARKHKIAPSMLSTWRTQLLGSSRDRVAEEDTSSKTRRAMALKQLKIPKLELAGEEVFHKFRADLLDYEKDLSAEVSRVRRLIQALN
jgi:transposase-like protein